MKHDFFGGLYLSNWTIYETVTMPLARSRVTPLSMPGKSVNRRSRSAKRSSSAPSMRASRLAGVDAGILLGHVGILLGHVA